MIDAIVTIVAISVNDFANILQYLITFQTFKKLKLHTYLISGT